jgi:hypothetical protein
MREKIFIIFLIAVVIVVGVFFVLLLHRIFFGGMQSDQSRAVDQKLEISNDQAAVIEPNDSLPTTPTTSPPSAVKDTPLQKPSEPIKIIKAVYVTGYSAGTKSYLNYLSDLFKNTEINAVVVDIKGSDGNVSYPGQIKDIDALIKFFHDKNIYVIGRIVVFEDPIFSKARPDLAVYDKTLWQAALGEPRLWRDNNGLSWLDPASKDVWDYNISLAKDAFLHGFDEVNFDYVRFPTDGKTENIGFPVWDGKITMADVIKSFFQYTREQLAGQKMSVDLFGQTTTNTDDMGIGQIIENAFENFDYVSPMVYPSHYVNGFMNFDNPAEHPYEIIKYSMLYALIREKIFLGQKLVAGTEPSLAKFRPWLQDFNMGAVYDAGMVGQEIKATQEALGDEYNGFMLWNPSNIYTQEAVLKPN